MTTTKPKSHRHRWRLMSFGGGGTRVPMMLHERCACGERRQRKPNREEARALRAEHRTVWDTSKNVHRVFHAFLRRFRRPDGTWKWSGRTLRERIERWSAKQEHADAVAMVRCGNDYTDHATLLCIAHATDDCWMGITVIVLPEYDDAPSEFFLYPHDHDTFITLCACIPEAAKLPRKADNVSFSNARRIARHFGDRFRIQEGISRVLPWQVSVHTFGGVPGELMCPPAAWRWTGWELMQRVTRWAKRQPHNRVVLLHIDDAHHMNSLCCAILCRTATLWEGILCYAIPQRGEEPGTFFLDPGSAKQLRAVLHTFRLRRIATKRHERAAALARNRAWRAVYAPPP